MWIDREGVVHTVALPDPTDVMSDGFKSSLDQLVARDSEAVTDLIEEEQDRLCAVDVGTTDGEEQYAGAAPPRGLLDKPVRTAEDLRSAVAAVDIRWRLDALMALEDYLS